MLIVFGILFALFLLIKFGDYKSRMELKAARDAFWKKEQEANNTRKVDISNLDYLQIPFDNLPFIKTDNETLNSLQNKVKALENEPILNLTGQSNTDLKLQYGTANITFLTKCDSNFETLIKALYSWGKELYSQSYINEAIQVLEYGTSIKTDIGKHYLLLGEIYHARQEYEKIDSLISMVEELQFGTKESVLSTLKEYKMSYFLD